MKATAPFSVRGVRRCAEIQATEDQVLEYPTTPSRLQIGTFKLYRVPGTRRTFPAREAFPFAPGSGHAAAPQ
jgi:hypothetical protein